MGQTDEATAALPQDSNRAEEDSNKVEARIEVTPDNETVAEVVEKKEEDAPQEKMVEDVEMEEKEDEEEDEDADFGPSIEMMKS